MNWLYNSSRNIYIFKEGGVNDSVKENYYRQAIPIIQDELYKTYNIRDKEAVHLILGSMSFESSHGTSQNAVNLYNFGGIGGGRKNKDGYVNWTKFDSFESGVRHQVQHIVDTFHGFENGYDPKKYIETLKKNINISKNLQRYTGVMIIVDGGEHIMEKLLKRIQINTIRRFKIPQRLKKELKKITKQ